MLDGDAGQARQSVQDRSDRYYCQLTFSFPGLRKVTKAHRHLSTLPAVTDTRLDAPANDGTAAVQVLVPLTRPSTDDAELSAVAEVLDSGWLAGQGPQSTALEDGFRQLTGRQHAIAVNNATAGLHLALAGLGLGAGDEVVVADYSFPATAHAVLYTGAVPVFADVREKTATIDPGLAEAAIGPRTRAVVAVDALGMPADWSELEEVAQRHGLFLIEDAACAAGGVYDGRPCGSFGDVAVFSLHARKGITCGEGGVVATDDAALAARVRSDACFGMESAFVRQSSPLLSVPTFPRIGYNYKLSDVLAAIATVQLGKIEGFLRRREAIAARYAELLAAVPGIALPRVPANRVPTWQTYAVTVEPGYSRDRLAAALRAEGIGCNIGTYALHRQGAYAPVRARCPVSARLFAQHLALPMYTELTDADQCRVAEALARAVTAG
jgi:perosamine synthetase